MGLKVGDSQANLYVENQQDDVSETRNNSNTNSSADSPASVLPNGDERFNNLDLYGFLMRRRFAFSAGESNLSPQTSSADLAGRADNLSKIFSRGIRAKYDDIAPFIQGLSEADARNLRALYRQKTGRDLLIDVSNHLFMEDRYKAFKHLAPERINQQILPQAQSSGKSKIVMNPPTPDIAQGMNVTYTIDLKGEIGEREVRYLIREDDKNVVREGTTFEAGYNETGTFSVIFEVKYKNQPPEYYTYRQFVRSADDKAADELFKQLGGAPDVEVYQAYLDAQIEQARQLLSELEAKKDGLYQELRNDVRNSELIYREIRAIEKQIADLKNKLPELEAARAEVANAFANSVEKPIPLQAVLVSKETGQTIPLQLYAKNLGGGNWAIVDVTNPNKPRTWTGNGLLPADALNEAWNKFVNGTNDLPAGQIAAIQPKGLGFQEGKIWNSESRGQSTLKQWSNGLGLGSLALAALGVAAIFGPGTQGAAIPLFLAAGVVGGASAGTNIADRVNDGSFKFWSQETAFDLLGIAGGLASVGGIGAATNVGRQVFANGARFNLQRFGNVTRISQLAEQGTNVAGAILIGNEYASAIDRVSRSNASEEQKAAEIQQILKQAAMAGGLIVLGVGLSRKFTPPSPQKLDEMLSAANLRPQLQQLVRDDLQVQKVFVNHGEKKLNELYDDFLREGKTGTGIKSKTFAQYLGRRGYSTSLDKETSTLADRLGEQNIARMSPRQLNDRILELTNPTLYRAARTGQLPPSVRQAVEEVLNTNQNFAAGAQFDTARARLVKQLNQAIGTNLQSVDELRQIQRLLGEGGASSSGSIGEWFSRRFLNDGKVIEKPTFTRRDYVADETRNPNQVSQQPEYLIVDDRRTVDVKTGYDNTPIDGRQQKDYNDLINASDNPRGKVRKDLAEYGIRGSLKTHDYLFLPSAEGSAEAVATREFMRISREFRDEAKNFRVFFVGDDGNLYQVVSAGPNRTSSVLVEGNKLPR